MFGKRKLEVDPDRQSFSPIDCLSQLEDTPENLTFESARSRTQSERQIIKNRPARNNLKVSFGPQSTNQAYNMIRSDMSNQKISDRNRKRTSRRSIIVGSFSNKNLTPQHQQSINNQIDLIQKTVQQRQNQAKHIFEKNNVLESIIKAQKIKKLQNNFIKKISRTSTVVEPVTYQLVQGNSNDSFLNSEGIDIHPLLDNLLNVLSVLQIITLLVIYSISIAFEDLISQNVSLSFLQLTSLFFYLIEIILNLISTKSQSGKQIKIIKEIIAYYANRSFLIDIISLIILLVDILTSLAGISYLRLFIFFKLPGCLGKIEKLEVYFIRNIYNEQYWQVAKVFLVNFCIAHIISLFLAGMTRFNQAENWMVLKGIANSGWLEKYIWSYYWATNIMLTVGFGDIVATNSFEAVCLIFLETFSCIVMAYNINCMGGIITNIRSENDKRSKKFKIFKKLSNQNKVPQELEFKINNYIQQSSKLKKKFNYEEDKQFLNELPEALKVSYLRQANKTVLGQLVFFKDLLDRTLYNFAEHLETVVCHPQEIIRNIDDDYNLMILKKGEIGYICKKNGCSLNDEIVDLIKVNNKDTPFLTSLDFLSKKKPPYQIKSLKFSVVFRLDYNKFIDIFKQSNMDYELFCFIRDKIRNIPDEFQVLPCTFCHCKFNHFKFTCPKLHYVPYQQHIIDKELYRQKIGRNDRKIFHRSQTNMIPPVLYYKILKNCNSEMRHNSKKSTISKMLQTGRTKGQFNNKPNSISLTSSILPDSDKHIKQMTSKDLQSILVIKTKQMLQMQFLRRQKKQCYEDDIWTLNLDVLTDYNSYFSQSNPTVLKDRFSPDQRIKQKLGKIDNYQKIKTLMIPQNSCIQDRQSFQKISSFISH